MQTITVGCLLGIHVASAHGETPSDQSDESTLSFGHTVHAMLMIGASTIGAAGIAYATRTRAVSAAPTRYFQLQENGQDAYNMHRTLMLLMSTLMLTGVVFAILGTPDGKHLHTAHSVFGVGIVGLVGMQAAWGYFLRQLSTCVPHDDRNRRIHRVCGCFLLAFIVAEGLMGCVLIGWPWVVAFTLAPAAVMLVILTLPLSLISSSWCFAAARTQEAAGHNTVHTAPSTNPGVEL